jgi:hypothetical protein
MKLAVGFICGLLGLGAVVAPASAQGDGNRPVGLVRELPVREVSDIAAGPEGERTYAARRYSAIPALFGWAFY